MPRTVDYMGPFVTRADITLFTLLLVLLGLAALLDPYKDVRAANAAPVSVTDPRTCAALAVYTQATADDWSQRATIAQATLNSYFSGAVPDCGNGAGAALSGSFSPARWQAALDAVDAVASGDYHVVPDACARANKVIPLVTKGTPQPDADTAVAARAQCVISGLAFVGGDR